MFKVLQAASILGCVYGMDIETADDAALAKLLMGEGSSSGSHHHIEFPEVRQLQGNATTATPTTTANPTCSYSGSVGVLVNMGTAVSATCCAAVKTSMTAGSYSAGLQSLVTTCPAPVLPPYFTGCVNENSTNTMIVGMDYVTPVAVDSTTIGKMPTDASYLGSGGVGCAYDQGCFALGIGAMQANPSGGALHSMFDVNNVASAVAAAAVVNVAKFHYMCMAITVAVPCNFGGPTGTFMDFGNLTPKCCRAATVLLKRTMNGYGGLPTSTQADEDDAVYMACEPNGCAAAIMTGLNAGTGSLKTTLQAGFDSGSDGNLDKCTGFQTTTATPTTAAPPAATNAATNADTQASATSAETQAATTQDAGTQAAGTTQQSGTQAAASTTPAATGNVTTGEPAATFAATAVVKRAVAITLQVSLGANETMASFVSDMQGDSPRATAFKAALVSGFRQSLGNDCPEATCTITITNISAARRALQAALRALQSSGGLKVEYEIETTADKAGAIGTKLADPTVLEGIGANVVAEVQADPVLSQDPAFQNFAVTGVSAEIGAIQAVTTAAPPAAAPAAEESSASKVAFSMAAFVLALVASA